MLAWINNSQLTGYWGADTPWWKVGLPTVTEDPCPSFFDSLNPVPPNTPATEGSVATTLIPDPDA